MGATPTDRETLTETNRKLVIDFYTMALIEDNYDEAIERYVGRTYIQHAPYVEDGVPGLLKFLNTREKGPGFVQRIHRVVADGELVALQVTEETSDGNGTLIMDLFRVEEGKVVEHWDVKMAFPDPATVPHGNGLI